MNINDPSYQIEVTYLSMLLNTPIIHWVKNWIRLMYYNVWSLK